MTNPRRVYLLALAACCALPSIAIGSPRASLEARFDAAIDPAEMGGWMKTMASEPNHVGSPHDKANAEFMAAKFREWGWDAKLETFEVLYPTPISETLEMVGPTPFKATLQESAIPEDATSGNTANALPAWVAFAGDGDVTADLVFVNYGMPDDYKALDRMGISVKGRIVIARYGGGWRGLKPKLAQEHGAIGCIIYSDPADDGYGQDDIYPKGPARPPQAFQRGSVADMTTYPGDPLTPGIGATHDAKRLRREDAATILKIPVLPISYGDAQHFLAALGGPVAPSEFRGALPIAYHIGPGPAQVHLATKADWSLKTIYDVVATMKGSEFPDQWVMRGNHHDGWVFGATDPLSGNIALMAEAKAIGALAKSGWRPKRTIVYLGWDAEEPMLLGSTEWAEEHGPELQRKAVAYINTDGNSRGFLAAGGSHSYQHLVNQVAADVTDPQTRVSVGERLRAKIAVDAAQGKGSKAEKDEAKDVGAGQDFRIAALGSGSDFSAYLQHLGLPTLDISYGGEGESGGVYHSVYDSYDHHRRFVDPGFAYDATLAKTVGRLVLRIADAQAPLQRYGDFADTIARYRDEVKELAESERDAYAAQSKLRANGYRLADDPLHSLKAPADEGPVPFIEFAALDNAVAHLKRSAAAFDTALAARKATLSAAKAAELGASLQTIEQTMLFEGGLPRRPWYKNLVYAPGRFTGYGAKTLPGVREAIEERRWADANRYSGMTGAALEAYATRLDQALAVLAR